MTRTGVRDLRAPHPLAEQALARPMTRHDLVWQNGCSIAHVVRGLNVRPYIAAIREPIAGFSAVSREASERFYCYQVR